MKLLNKIFVFSILLYQTAFGQRDHTITTELSATVGSNIQSAFWLRANQFGAAPKLAQTGVFQIGANSGYSKNNNNKINWGYCINFIGFAGAENKVFIQEAYVKAKWKAFEIYGGRRKEIQGLVDTTLTSGSYIWSGNALPMPKLQISIPNFTALKPSGVLSIKGSFAHGWFENTRSDAKNMFLHQKSLYFKIGRENQKMKFYGGFNHQAQWGGTAKTISARKYEGSIKDYLGVVAGKSNVGNDTTGLDPNNAGNRTGNHLGSIDIGFEINFSKANLFIYRQSIYEDGSLFYLNNITDGLNGLSLNFKKQFSKNFQINKINFEFFNTLSQGGPEGSEALFASRRGQDNYFNNLQYFDGWSSHNTSIGTPFILTAKEIGNQPIPLNPLFTNNFIQAYYLGIEGIGPSNIFFRNKISFSKNWGYSGLRTLLKSQTSWSFFTMKQFVGKKFGSFQVYNEIGLDIGDLLSSNFAVNIGIKKSWENMTFLGHPTHKHIR